MRAHIKILAELNRNIWGVKLSYNFFFVLLQRNTLTEIKPEKVPILKHFRNISTECNKHGSKWKLITRASCFRTKKSKFWFFSLTKSLHLLRQLFLQTFGFLQTYIFDFRKWGNKWILMRASIHFSQNKSEIK